MNFKEIIDKLNSSIYNDDENEFYHYFVYEYAGFVDVIKFDEQVLWHSEDDDREFNEDENDWEPMVPFIIKKFKEYRDELNSFKI